MAFTTQIISTSLWGCYPLTVKVISGFCWKDIWVPVRIDHVWHSKSVVLLVISLHGYAKGKHKHLSIKSLFQEERSIYAAVHMRCCGHVRLCMIRNCFALYGGMSFMFVVLTRLNVSELKHWVTSSQYTLDNVFKHGHKMKNIFCLNIWLQSRQSVQKHVFKPEHQTKIFVV